MYIWQYAESFTINGGSISNNTSNGDGGGIFTGTDSKFTVTMNGGTVSGNVAAGNGGGIFTRKLIMNDGSICENRTKGIGRVYGGGIYADTFTINGGTISKNNAWVDGGGVYASTFIMKGGTISGNKSNYNGGGVCVTSILTIFDGNISGNTADLGGGVYVDLCGEIEVSGNPVILKNVKNGTMNETTGLYENGIASNIYLASDQTITVVGTLNNRATIGVTTSTTPTNYSSVTVARGSTDPVYTITASDVAKFTSDNGHLVEFDSTNNTILIVARTYLKGDANLDGEVNADDLTALARHVAKIEALTDDYALLSADVDDNGSLSADDLTKLARYVAKIIPSL